MKVLLFGATGMVGQGVLRECLLDPEVTSVLLVARSATGRRHPKLRELVRPDLFQLGDVTGELAEHDVCLFCLGAGGRCGAG
jgi:uncharacterized protein YbjT (DUF2867 family)